MKIKYILYVSLLAFIVSCKPEVDEFSPSKGVADFTTYVAVGNSLTAGYADGALYQSGQMYGWANILSQQLSVVGGGQFVQPMVNSEFGVLPGKLKLGFSTDCLGVTSMGPVPDVGELDPFTNHIEYAVNNLGVPGAKVGHLLAPGYGNPAGVAAGLANPYYVKFATTPEISVVEQALSMSPTFFSLWIGNNDVLGYATSGGAGDVITPVDEFGTYYNMLAQSLSNVGVKGVVANIPSVTTAAFFTTIPYNVIDIPDSPQGEGMVALLNAGYADYNTFMEGNGFPYRVHFEVGPNPMVIMDAGMANVPAQLQFRQMNDTELALLTLPQDSIKCATWGSVVPVPTQYILTDSEIELVTEATNQFNEIIRMAAVDYELAFVDINSLMAEATTNGLTYDGVTFTPTFVTGNLFSLDGIHLTPQGNAVVANAFIEAISTKYGANIPRVAMADYPPVQLP